ncbi:MAG: transcriptional regulator [Eubacterium sp. 36_13]|nr:MAG: transcriptional regulator [Eubacterium sp. 36_13]
MSELYLMVTIINRNLTKKFMDFYTDTGLEVSMTAAGSGTAANEILDYFGLEGSEKSVLFHVVTDGKWSEVKRKLSKEMKIDIPGVGIAFVIRISSIGGKKALNYLTCGQEFVKGDESVLKETKYELVVVIANKGYSEDVMDAARKVHAAGGTVIHAKGTGAKKAEKFLGVTLVPEKDMIFIVTKTENKNDIMRAIMDEAGFESKAKSIVFSIPVTDTAGMRLMEEIEESMHLTNNNT